MKKIATSLLFAGALLLAGHSVAQAPPDLAPRIKKDATPAAPVTAPMSVGTAFNTILAEPLDTRRAKAGDVVTTVLAEDVNYEQSVVLPKGTKVIGHIVRTTSGGHGRAGSALFIQFDKAVLGNGEEALVNAGIQALAASSVTPAPIEGDALPGKPEPNDTLEPVQEGPLGVASPQVVSTIYDAPTRRFRDPLSPLLQGEINSDGLFTPESKGAFGRPDVKIYTPTSEGSHGTVLLSTKKQMHLDSGTRLLLVVQPPPSIGGDEAESIPLEGTDQP